MQQVASSETIKRWESEEYAVALVEQTPWRRFLDAPHARNDKGQDRTHKAFRTRNRRADDNSRAVR
jgi:hypothetical protein